MGLEGIVLSEIRERHIPYDFTCMCNLQNKINKEAGQKQTHRCREKADGCQRGREMGGLGEKGEEIKKYKLAVTK